VKTNLALFGLLAGLWMPAQAAITVTNLNDSGPGSLRQAIADVAPGDSINFAVTGTITLTSGQLEVNTSTTILGPGPAKLAVDGNGVNTVFVIMPGNTVEIVSLTITNGFADAGTRNGGAIVNNFSTLTVSNCTITGNSAYAAGGGIYNNAYQSGSATLSVFATTFSGNSAVSGAQYGGGAIFNQSYGGSGMLTVSDCTFSDNTGFGGGGIYNWAGTVTIASSTFSGNAASTSGNAILNSGGTVQIKSTILAASDPSETIANYGGVITSLGYNLSSDDGAGFLTARDDQIMTDPKLAPLADNGGPTWTHALLPGSPAVDQGSSSGLATDQRGYPRIFKILPAYLEADDGSDIGAYELQGTTVVVTWTNPAAIGYGMALGSNQLDATFSVPGTTVYDPPTGTVLTAGTNILTVIFTPSDTTYYTGTTDTVTLIVQPAVLTVTASDTNRVYGATNPAFTGVITGLQNSDNISATYDTTATASSSVGGYAIVPALVDPNGRLANYTVTTNNGLLTISKAVPVITWATPAAIAYGTALGSNQLDATFSVPGTTVYDPPAGTVLPPGTSTLAVVFAPTDGTDYSMGTDSVNLVVLPAYTPIITEQPANQTATNGGSATFAVGVSGAAPFGYQWYFRNPNLQIAAGGYAQMLNGFVYGVVVTNSGSGYTAVPQVNFVGGGGVAAAGAARISRGRVVAVTVTNAGSNYVTLPTVEIAPPNGVLSGQTNALLTISDLTTNKVGCYFVIITNAWGSVTSSWATLTLSLPPGITRQPQSESVPVGGNIQFSVSANGSSPLSYQWFVASEVQSNAMATPEVIHGFVLRANIISGGAGYLAAPTVQIVGGSGSGAAGYAVVSNGAVSVINISDPGSGYTRAPTIRIGAPTAISLFGQTNLTLALIGVTSGNKADYFIEVTNDFGSVTSAIATLTVFLPPTNFRVRSSGGHTVTLNMTGSPNYPYVLQTTTNLETPVNWTPAASIPADASGNWQFTDTNLNARQKFYRAFGQ